MIKITAADLARYLFDCHGMREIEEDILPILADPAEMAKLKDELTRLFEVENERRIEAKATGGI